MDGSETWVRCQAPSQLGHSPRRPAMAYTNLTTVEPRMVHPGEDEFHGALVGENKCARFSERVRALVTVRPPADIPND